jgi:hypothetical protein
VAGRVTSCMVFTSPFGEERVKIKGDAVLATLAVA